MATNETNKNDGERSSVGVLSRDGDDKKPALMMVETTEDVRSSLGLTVELKRHGKSLVAATDVPAPWPRDCLRAEGDGRGKELSFVTEAFQRRFRRHAQRKRRREQDDGDGHHDNVDPTPVQLQAWSILLRWQEGSTDTNLVAVAPTGSGKTLAYGLPLLYHADHDAQAKKIRGVRGLVLVPTRELALQVTAELHRCVTHQGDDTISPVMAVYGGSNSSRDEQLERLSSKGYRRKVHVLVATPGRLLDLVTPSSTDGTALSLKHVRSIVVDEADRMLLQLGMADQVHAILKACPRFHVQENRKEEGGTTLCLFSATFPRKLEQICRDLSRRDDHLVVVRVETNTFQSHQPIEKKENGEKKDNDDGPSHDETPPRPTTELTTIPTHVTQILHVCASHKKPKKLFLTLGKVKKSHAELSLQDKGRSRRVLLTIVFFKTIKTLKHIHKSLQTEGFKCTEFHGKMLQQQRENALRDFKAGKTLILLATDMAARGIHVKNLECVINYDFPSSLEQYVHRCGRAGRDILLKRDTTATVYSFFHRELAPMAKDVLSLLRTGDSWIDPNLIELAATAVPARKPKKKKERGDVSKQDDAATPVEVIAQPRPQSPQPNGEVKKKRKRRGGVANRAKRLANSLGATAAHNLDGDVEDDDDDGEFAALLGNRIVLKRADHVSEAEESSAGEE